MRSALAVTFVVALAFIGGCGGKEPDATVATAGQPAAPVSLTPEELGELGAKINKEPARANEILAARGLNQEKFEVEIRKVTENPDASKRYATAFRKASA